MLVSFAIISFSLGQIRAFVLYQKYRPQFFSELVGQDHIKEILLEALKQQRVAHAYLFSGPRGTGKTSTARLLAKALNCLKPRSSGEPCGKCSNCEAFQEGKFMDLIEIDAASNRGIDNIRELRDRIALAPSGGRYKVYIIDEVHMLSIDAFNALLKTLEEPPSNVVFILATTEPFAVPQTIISRCQRFDFKPIDAQEIYKALQRVARKEKIKIEANALKVIAIYAQGALRDAFSFLDQVASLRGKITEERVKKALGIVELGALVRIFDALIKKDKKVVAEIQKEAEKGYAAIHFINSFLRYLEDLVFLKNTGEILSPVTRELKTKMVRQAESFSFSELAVLYQLLLEARSQSRDLEVATLPVEIALLRFIEQSPSVRSNSPGLREEKAKQKKSRANTSLRGTKSSSGKSPGAKSKASAGNKSRAQDIKISPQDFEAKWQKVIEEMKSYNHSLSAFLSKSQAKYAGGKIYIRVPFKLYHATLSMPKNLDYLHKIVHKIFHHDFEIELHLAQERPTQEIKKIFGL